MKNTSEPYKNLCTEFYELDKPFAPAAAIDYYVCKAAEAQGKILEPMCGTGRFLIPLLEKGFEVVGFDSSANMLEVCKNKCKEQKLKTDLIHTSFKSFKSHGNFQLVFIPSGSFCLLVHPNEAKQALKVIFDGLMSGGKLIFEIETVKSVNNQQGVWQSRWINKPDGSLLVGSFASCFDEQSHIETTLCRYERWQNNSVVQVEVEDFRLRLYERAEIEKLIKEQGFAVEKACAPYTEHDIDDNTSTILYECIKLA